MLVYGAMFTPEEIKERESWHKTTWLEWEIPKELEDELSKIIASKIAEFGSKCGCGLCQLHKNNGDED